MKRNAGWMLWSLIRITHQRMLGLLYLSLIRKRRQNLSRRGIRLILALFY